MDDLANEMAMSKKTLYAHFPSKRALLEAVIQHKFYDIDHDLKAITSGASSNCLHSLERLLDCMQRHMEEIQPSFVRDMRRGASDLFQLVERRRRDIIQRHFGQVLLQGRRTGLIRQDIPPRLAIEILLGVMHAIMNPPKMEELGLTPKQGFTAIIKVVFEGLMTEKPRAS